MLYQAYQAHADIMRPVRWFAGFAAMAEDAEMTEDLIAAACNDAANKVAEMSAARMAEVTGGMNLPPGMKLPF